MNSEHPEVMNKNTRELTEEDLAQATGGMMPNIYAGAQLGPADGKSVYPSPRIGGSLEDDPGHLIKPQ